MSNKKLSKEAENPALNKGAVSNCGGVNELICPKCKHGRDLKYKRYFMFGKVCSNCGSYVKLPTHPDYGK